MAPWLAVTHRLPQGFNTVSLNAAAMFRYRYVTHHDESWRETPTRSIARATGVERTSVIRTLRRLETWGFLQIIGGESSDPAPTIIRLRSRLSRWRSARDGWMYREPGASKGALNLGQTVRVAQFATAMLSRRWPR